MAAIVTQAPARVIEIDGANIAFDDIDLKMARVHANKVGLKGPLKKEDLEKWYRDGEVSYTLPEPAEKKAKVAKDDGNDVTATLVYKLITAKGGLGAKDYSEDITKADVRRIRKGLRGKYSADNLLQAVLPKVQDNWSLIEIVDANDNVYKVEKAEDNSWIASRDRESTETVLRNRVKEMREVIEAYEAKLAERDSE